MGAAIVACHLIIRGINFGNRANSTAAGFAVAVVGIFLARALRFVLFLALLPFAALSGIFWRAVRSANAPALIYTINCIVRALAGKVNQLVRTRIIYLTIVCGVYFIYGGSGVICGPRIIILIIALTLKDKDTLNFLYFPHV